MTRLVSLALCAVVLCPPAAARAQTCSGTASFASGPARIGAAVDFAEDTKQYGAQIAFGRAAGPFAAGSVGRADIQDTDESVTTFALDLGYSLGGVGGQGSVDICPIVGFAYGTAELEEGLLSADISSRLLSVGFAIGSVVSSSPTFKLVPSASLTYAHENVKAEGDLELDQSEDFGHLSLAAGFVFNERVTLRPNVVFPFGLEGADPTYGIGISFNFGTPATSR